MILEFEPPTWPGEAAQQLHGIKELNGQLADLGCLLITRRSKMNMVEERENGHNGLSQLKESNEG